MEIRIKHLTKAFPSRNPKKNPEDTIAVNDFDLDIKDGELLGLLGPSGCGKSTTLYMISGLKTPTSGEIWFGDSDVTNLSPEKRGIGLVFQNYALYPHMTVFDNMAFGLKLRKVPKDEIERKVNEAAKILDLTHLLDRKPKAMSGGQRQRVALGRAIVRSPKVFLLDEPLSNLDAKLRAQMRTEIAKLHQKLGTTFIYVTHDQTEAMTMGDRIVVMKDGYIQQIDTPTNLYNNPVNQFVAGFIGSPQMNFIDSKLLKIDGKYVVEFGSEDTKTTRGVKYQVAVPESKVDPEVLEPLVDQEVVLGVRPECIHDEPAFLAQATTGVINTTVEVTEMMGAETYLYLNCEGIQLTARVSPRSDVRPQDELKVAIDPNRIHIFDKETEKAVLN